MDFNLTEEHLMIQQAARDFCCYACEGCIQNFQLQVKMMADLGFME
jgi:hypothetical protein